MPKLPCQISGLGAKAFSRYQSDKVASNNGWVDRPIDMCKVICPKWFNHANLLWIWNNIQHMTEENKFNYQHFFFFMMMLCTVSFTFLHDLFDKHFSFLRTRSISPFPGTFSIWIKCPNCLFTASFSWADHGLRLIGLVSFLSTLEPFFDVFFLPDLHFGTAIQMKIQFL